MATDLTELLGASDAFIEDAVDKGDAMVLRGLIHPLRGEMWKFLRQPDFADMEIQ